MVFGSSSISLVRNVCFFQHEPVSLQVSTIPIMNSNNSSSNNDIVMQYVVYQVPASEVVVAESWLERRHISRNAQPQQQQHLSTSHIFAAIESTQVSRETESVVQIAHPNNRSTIE